MALRSRNRVEVSYSVAGMTDIIFLLLLFFLLTSTLINPNALNLLLPKSNNQVPAKPMTTVSITKDIQFYVDRKWVNVQQLESVLRMKVAGRKDPVVSIHADRSVPIEHIVTIMNIARRNNYKVILATSPEK
ncbi:MAG: biopolymer transporter ExbD [Bacteroidales bacterium]|nr:biopolymer transporter ExbD [Bacteroidales bacterium]